MPYFVLFVFNCTPTFYNYVENVWIWKLTLVAFYIMSDPKTKYMSQCYYLVTEKQVGRVIE